ncbi:MAG TPA: FGGY-family carbohydrate kinase [Prolixibacteraceae bacterium]|nr:FGGY-family carbohydrate kinase [Prolixibacteraceae bacterium]
MDKTVLSIDCGTQSLRAMLFSPTGKLLSIAKEGYEPYFSQRPGWAEQNPEIYWDALKKVCLQLRQKNPEDFKKIAGVGITALRNTMINVNENGTPLRPAILWLDQRKAEPVYKPSAPMKLVIKSIGIGDTLNKAQRDGKCNWIKQHQPQIWEQTHKYLQVSGYLNYKLTGQFNDSVAAQIGHVPFNYKRQKWGNPKKMLAFSAKLFPVEKGKLPELVKPGNTIGEITPAAARETGLPEKLPVIACGSDKSCETLGMGVLSPELASLSFGTTATIQTTSKSYLEPIRFMPSYPAVIPGKYNPEVEIFRGFWMITWFKNEFAQKEVEEAEAKGIAAEVALNELLCQSPPGSMGLVVQPFWSPGLSEPAAKGAMIGFGDVHKKPHIYRAVIEGLMFALLDGKEKIERVSGKKIGKLAVSGGASQSDEICQIAADVFNLPIVRAQTSETSGLGAAIVTAVGTGIYNSIDMAAKNMVHYTNEFYPNPEHVQLYQQLFTKVYRKMYKTLEPLYHQIREITGYPE